MSLRPKTLITISLSMTYPFLGSTIYLLRITFMPTAKARVEDVDLSGKWLIDSGASRIMCSNRHWLHQFPPLSPPIMITLGDNSTVPATGQGRIQVRMNTGGRYERAMLHDVLYVPDMGGNLLSVSHFARHGGEVRFKGDKFRVLDKAENTSCIGHLRGNLYIIDTKVVTNEHAKVAFVNNFPSESDDPPPMALAATSSTAIADLTTWHRRLGHLNADAVSMMFGHAGHHPHCPLRTVLKGQADPCGDTQNHRNPSRHRPRPRLLRCMRQHVQLTRELQIHRHLD